MNARHNILICGILALSFTLQAQESRADDALSLSVKKHGKKLEQFFLHTPAGELLETGFHRARKADLTWIQYNQQGEKRALAQYKKGVKQGTWLIWDAEGYLKYEIHYVNNKIARAVERDRTGALVASR